MSFGPEDTQNTQGNPFELREPRTGFDPVELGSTVVNAQYRFSSQLEHPRVVSLRLGGEVTVTVSETQFSGGLGYPPGTF